MTGIDTPHEVRSLDRVSVPSLQHTTKLLWDFFRLLFHVRCNQFFDVCFKKVMTSLYLEGIVPPTIVITPAIKEDNIIAQLSIYPYGSALKPSRFSPLLPSPLQQTNGVTSSSTLYSNTHSLAYRAGHTTSQQQPSPLESCFITSSRMPRHLVESDSYSAQYASTVSLMLLSGTTGTRLGYATTPRSAGR